MSIQSHILALDLGTSSLKAGLFSQDYNLILTDKAGYGYNTCGTHVQIQGLLKCQTWKIRKMKTVWVG